jgi:integrase
MTKPQKLPSGAWRTQAYYKDADGKVYRPSFTADTKAECIRLAAEFETNKKAELEKRRNGSVTVGEAVDRYIQLSAPTLSPTTVERYEKMRKFGFPKLMEMSVGKLSNEVVQEHINEEAKRTSLQKGTPIKAKTLANEWGLISTALGEVCNLTFKVKLPKEQATQKDLPAPQDVINLVIGTRYELPALLAMWLSFSISEIMGLRCSSVRNGCIYIDQVQVYANGEEQAKNNAKVSTRKRKLKVPQYIMSLIAELPHYQEYLNGGEDAPLMTLTRWQISQGFIRHMKRNGITMTFHELRHENASIMLAKNIPEKYAMQRGGWKTPHVMKRVYEHTFDEKRNEVDVIIDDVFDNMILQGKNRDN